MNAIFVTNRKWVINKHTSKDRRKASVSHNKSHYCGESGWKCMLLYLLFFSQRQSAPARGIAGVCERRELAHLCKGESSVKHLQLHYHQINDSRRWERGNMVRSSFLSFSQSMNLNRKKPDAIKLLVIIVPVGNGLIYDVVCWNSKGEKLVRLE